MFMDEAATLSSTRFLVTCALKRTLSGHARQLFLEIYPQTALVASLTPSPSPDLVVPTRVDSVASGLSETKLASLVVPTTGFRP